MGDIELLLAGPDRTAEVSFEFFELISRGSKTLAVKDSFFTFELKVDENGAETLHFFPDDGEPAMIFEKQE